MKSMKFLMMGLFVVVMLSIFAYAQNGDSAKKDNLKPELYGVNNLTYGSCVSSFAVVKNGCFQASKDVKATCKIDAKNVTDVRAATKQCNKDYRASKKQCKVDFKASKKECKKLNQKAK